MGLGFTFRLTHLPSSFIITHSLPPVTLSDLVPATRWSGPSLGPGFLLWGPQPPRSSGVLFPPVDLCVTLAVASPSQQTHLPTPSRKCHVQAVSQLQGLLLGLEFCPGFILYFLSLEASASSTDPLHPFQSSSSGSSHSLPPVFPVLSLPIA